MKLKLKTLKLQEMVSKAIKGASNNKMIPITGIGGQDYYRNNYTYFKREQLRG